MKPNWVLLLLALVGIGLHSPPAIAANGTNYDIGNETAAIIASADSVKAWPTVGLLHPDGANWIDYFKKSGNGVTISASLDQLKGVLLDSNTYPHYRGSPAPPGKACMPEPGVEFTFTKGTQTVEVYVCFSCDIIIVNPWADPKKKEPGIGGIDFDPGHNRLLNVVKKIFPKVRKVQEIRNREN